MSAKILNISVTCQGQEDVVFKIKDDTDLSKLMERYCQQILNKKITEVIFTYDGIEIKSEDTPKKLKMKTNDTVHVTMTQVGGGMIV